jgi:hypothetical protein
MNRIKFTLIVSFALLLKMFAKDYQTIYSDRTSFFIDQGNQIRCIKIDSVSVENDSVFFAYSNILSIDKHCFTPFGYSWIGRKILIKKDYNIFLNIFGDSIFIKTNAKLNEKWVAFRQKDSLIIYAQVINIEKRSFLGLNDTVKTINFITYNKMVEPISLESKSFNIELSKNYGLIKTLNFSYFPNYTSFYFDLNLDTYELIGLSKPKVGVQNLTWFDVYDFNLNDEIHVLYENSSWDQKTNTGNSISQSTIYKYLERKNNKDSIIYSVERKMNVFRRIDKWDNTNYSFIHDTITSIFTSNPAFDKLPLETIFENRSVYFNSMSFGVNISKNILLNRIRKNGRDSCWGFEIVDGCLYSPVYLKGLGGPYYSCNNFSSAGGINMQLVYYKKGGNEWGNPMIFSKINEIEKEINIKIYPNPLNEIIQIEVDFSFIPINFELYDLSGKIVLNDKITSNNKSLSLKDINDGFYIYNLVKNSKILKKGKILKYNASR